MRKVTIEKKETGLKVEIETPWFPIRDAAAYLGLSRSEFTKHAGHIPAYVVGKSRRYHVTDLDEFAAGTKRPPGAVYMDRCSAKG